MASRGGVGGVGASKQPSSSSRNASAHPTNFSSTSSSSSSLASPNRSRSSPCSTATSSRALSRLSNPHTNLGSMLRKLIDKKPASGAGNHPPLPSQPILKTKANAAPKPSNLTSFSRKLFGKQGASSGQRSLAPPGPSLASAPPPLREVKSNTRTLAMVLRSERELLAQNKEYEVQVSDLCSLLHEKSQQVERLKDLCLKQKGEIAALKDAILFPNPTNSELQELLLPLNQGSQLNHANQLIPALSRQVSSLSGQVQCLVQHLAEEKSEKYAAKVCFEGNMASPGRPRSDRTNSLSPERSSGHSSQDERLLEDLNPCLTPIFRRSKPKKELEDLVIHDDRPLTRERERGSEKSSSRHVIQF